MVRAVVAPRHIHRDVIERVVHERAVDLVDHAAVCGVLVCVHVFMRVWYMPWVRTIQTCQRRHVAACNDSMVVHNSDIGTPTSAHASMRTRQEARSNPPLHTS